MAGNVQSHKPRYTFLQFHHHAAAKPALGPYRGFFFLQKHFGFHERVHYVHHFRIIPLQII